MRGRSRLAQTSVAYNGQLSSYKDASPLASPRDAPDIPEHLKLRSRYSVLQRGFKVIWDKATVKFVKHKAREYPYTVNKREYDVDPESLRQWQGTMHGVTDRFKAALGNGLDQELTDAHIQSLIEVCTKHVSIRCTIAMMLQNQAGYSLRYTAAILRCSVQHQGAQGMHAARTHTWPYSSQSLLLGRHHDLAPW